MTCREFVEVVTEYLEGELSEERRRELHEHIDECGGCSAYLDQMKQTVAALGGLRDLAPDNLPATREAALSAFRAVHDRGG